MNQTTRIVCGCGAVGSLTLDRGAGTLIPGPGWRALFIPCEGDEGALLVYRCGACLAAAALAASAPLAGLELCRDELLQVFRVTQRLDEVFWEGEEAWQGFATPGPQEQIDYPADGAGP